MDSTENSLIIICSFYEWSDVMQRDLNMEVWNLNSNEVTSHVNQMESHLNQVETSYLDIRVKLCHDTPFVEWAYPIRISLEIRQEF